MKFLREEALRRFGIGDNRVIKVTEGDVWNSPLRFTKEHLNCNATRLRTGTGLTHQLGVFDLCYTEDRGERRPGERRRGEKRGERRQGEKETKRQEASKKERRKKKTRREMRREGQKEMSKVVRRGDKERRDRETSREETRRQ